MNILFVVPYVPNLIRVRPYNLLRQLVARGHKVTLVTLWTSPEELAEVEALRSGCHRVVALPQPAWRSLWNCLLALPGGTPLQAVYSWHPGLAGRIGLLRDAEGEDRIDVVHVEHLRGSRYGLALQEEGRHHQSTHRSAPPVVWDSVDCISHLFRQAGLQSKKLTSRLMTRFEQGRTARYEAWLIRQFERVLVTSEVDRQALMGLDAKGAPPAPIRVITNGVDLAYFAPDPSAYRLENALVLSGKMSYHANVSMAVHLVEEIMPAVWARLPETVLYIVGKSPSREVLRLGEHPRVRVTGTVPDLREYLLQATVAVTPILYGAGIQNKNLEAMACETPVVTTPLGAAALAAEPGRQLMVAAGPQAFAEAVLELLENPERRQAMAREGRRYVETHHDWSHIAAQLEQTYEEAILERAEAVKTVDSARPPAV
jgi:glycosyltransferase involved in cell wall biosynthesis